MNLNTTPTAERIHIGIFGKRNAGKSSLINALTNQNLAIVSPEKGTTTDPVYKAMELLPLGPVTIIDTPGIDDIGELGKLRIEKTYQVLNKCDIALLVIDAILGFTSEDKKFWELINKKNIPAIIILNKADLLDEMQQAIITMNVLKFTKHCFIISTQNGYNINKLKNAVATLKSKKQEHQLLENLIKPCDIFILVTPIDSSAPKGRLILPQQLILRNILDNKGIAVVVQENELSKALANLNQKPRLVITDSQVFAKVSKIIPPTTPITSFSILMARYKGSLNNSIRAVRSLDSIHDGDKILISEGCTHHRQCQDIGTVKIPEWIRKFTNAEPKFFFSSGTEFPVDLSSYKLIIHCGACMLNEREIAFRNQKALEQKIPMTNYGIAIAYMHGILKRSIAPFPDIAKLLE